ncbi:hypothetical protein AB0J25_24580 [Streptomyces sp. NPDC049910]
MAGFSRASGSADVEIQPGVGVRRRERPVDPGTLNKPFDGRVPPFGMG